MIPLMKVKHEGVHRNSSLAERNIPNVPIVPEVMMYLCPKISDSPNRKQKEASRSSWDEDQENQPAKVARHVLVPVVKSEALPDTDEDLETPPVRDKISSPRKPFARSLDRSNKPVAGPMVQDGKLRYDPIWAMKMLQERQDIPGSKRDPHAGAVSPGCNLLWQDAM